MPVYSWKGIDPQGRPLTGTLFARSYNHLESMLLKKEIGLVHARAPLIDFRLTPLIQQRFFFQLSSLIKAHIPVYDALLIIAGSTRESSFKAIVDDLAALIAQGIPLSEALELHNLSDELTKAVMVIGEKTGDVGAALQGLVDHQASMATFKAKVRSALTAPLITLLFFLVVLVGLFLFVIPRFESYFSSYNAPLPLMTSLMLQVSSFMRSSRFLYVLSVQLIGFLALYRFLRTERGGSLWQRVAFKVPLVGSFLIEIQQTQLLQALGMLLKSGVPLSQALSVCCSVSKNGLVKEQIARIQLGVETGQAFSVSWNGTLFSHSEIEAFLTLGESSGQLASLIAYAAEIARQRVYGRIGTLVTLIQPALILLLGACIAALIFAVYMPIITLSSLIV